jgi:hypothetical protein
MKLLKNKKVERELRSQSKFKKVNGLQFPLATSGASATGNSGTTIKLDPTLRVSCQNEMLPMFISH